MLHYASAISSVPPPYTAPSRPEAAPAFADIETQRTRLHLVRDGISRHWPCSYVYQPCGQDEDISEDGWLWEGVGQDGESLGFIGLVPVRPAVAPSGIFGPALTVMLKRDLAPGLGTEIVTGLMRWLKRNHICHVVHASHAEDDRQLAAWLDLCGFLYTGCHETDGSRSMILIL